MTNLRMILTGVCLLLVIACGDDQDTVEIVMDQGPRQLGDEFVPPPSDMGTEESDATSLTDMNMRMEVTDCPSLCMRLSDCNRNLLGARDTCVDECTSLTALDGFPGFLSCVNQAECSQLDSCIVPEPPPPSCEEVCGVLDACDPANTLPEAFADVDTCENACADESKSAAIVLCGSAFVDGSATCDGNVFSQCLADQLYPTCYAVCDRKIMCNAAEDLLGCVVDCAAPMAESDPIIRRRARLRQTCWQTADTCETALQCDDPISSPTVDPSALCTADVPCSLIDSPCEDTVSALGPAIGDAALRCVAEEIAQNCGAPLAQCFTEADIDPLDCDEYCSVAALCDELTEGIDKFQCISDCRAAITDGNPESINQFRRPTACAYANTCADLSDCLGQSGDDDICSAACAHLNGCETDSPVPDCMAQCGNSNSLRQDVYWSCNALVDVCDNPSQCSVPPAPDCTTICDGLQACGVSDPSCVRSCDDAAFLDADTFVQRYACHAVARNCPDRERCENGDYQGGNACVQHCRNVLACAGDQQQMLTCIDECADGLSGETGLAFELNYICLQALAPAASCEEIAACNQTATPEAVCGTVCQAQSACELLASGEDVAGCEAACRPEVATNPDAYACALRAGRVANGCIDLAACLDIEVPAADPACVTQCSARAQCDETTDQFLCERRCDPMQDGTSLRLACLEAYSDCPSVLACLDNPLENPQLCSGICGTLDQCGSELGADGRYLDVAECETECGIEALVNEESDHATILACLGEADCISDDVEACFSGSVPTCDNAWTAYEDCGNDTNFLWSFVMPPVTDRASYVAFCNGLIATEGASVIEPKLECVINAAANGMCDQQIACAF